jgi:hypothetical protein
MARALRGCAVCVVLSAALVPTASAAAKPTVVRGKLKEVIVDYRDGRSATRYLVVSGRHVTKVRPTGAVKAGFGEAVRVKGHWRHGALEGQIAQVRSAATASAAAKPTRAEEGIRTLAVLIISYPGHPAEASAESIRSPVFTSEGSANVFYRFESYGKIGFRGILNPEGDVFGPYEVAGSTEQCPTEASFQEAIAAAEGNGIPMAQYQHIYGVFPHSTCSWSGLADIGGRYAKATWYDQPFLYAHELGHNLGFGHANSLRCVNASGEPVAIELESEAQRCSLEEYGDPFDVMGGWVDPTRNNNVYLKFLGVLTDANIETVMEPGTYTMQASLTDPAQVKFLRVPAERTAGGEVKRWYYLEVRAAGSPFEPYDVYTAQQGVSIRRVGTAQWNVTALIDTNPQTTDRRDAPLAPGRTFSDGKVTIETLSVTNDLATVSITTPDWIAPSTPTDLEGHAVPQGLELSWSPSSDNIGVIGYRVYRDGSEIGRVDGTTTSFLDTTGAYGSHVYGVAAEDAAPSFSVRAGARFSYPDIVAPSAPSSLRAAMIGSSVELRWQASSDNAGPPRYLVFRDGEELGETTAQQLLDAGPPVGQHSYTVYAEDGAGNRSSPAPPIFLTIAELQALAPPGGSTGGAANGATGNPPSVSFKHVPLAGKATLLLVRVLNPDEIHLLELIVDGKRIAFTATAKLKVRWAPPPGSPARHRVLVRLRTADGRTLARTFRFREPTRRPASSE